MIYDRVISRALSWLYPVLLPAKPGSYHLGFPGKAPPMVKSSLIVRVVRKKSLQIR